MEIINESTSVLLLNTAGVQNGSNLTVYLSSTTTPGQLVTVLDAMGYMSSPQSIVITPVGAATIPTSFIQQRFGYITMVSQNHNDWLPVACNSFPTTAPIYYRALDAFTVTTSTLRVYGFISTPNLITSTIDIRESSITTGQIYANSINVNNYQAYQSTSITDPKLRITGTTNVNGQIDVVGTFNIRGNLSAIDIFAGKNMSSKNGTIYVGGNVSVEGSIRGQRGNLIQAQALSTFSSASFNLPVSISTNVSADSVSAKTISTVSATATSLTASTILFSSTQGILYQPTYLNFRNTPVTTPSISTTSLVGSGTIATNEITFESFGPASTLRQFNAISSQITNADGSLQTSSIAGMYLTISSILSKTLSVMQMTTGNLSFNDQPNSITTVVQHPPNTSTIIDTTIIPTSWSISSIGSNGTFTGKDVKTNLLSADFVLTDNLITVNDKFLNFHASSMRVTNSIFFSSANTFSLKNVELFNIGGSIKGSKTEIAHDLAISTIQTDLISSSTDIYFIGNTDFSLSTTSISSLNSIVINTSSLKLANASLGIPVEYSTINPTAAWLLTSTSNTSTSGLGTYFDQAIFSASQNQDVYYSVINPLSEPAYLSTPYINTRTGVGSIGYAGDDGPASNAAIGYMIGQPAIDSQSNVYFGADYAGWTLRKINMENTITTIGGANQYFYGDGRYPTTAALGPRMAIGLVAPATVLITDISNVRLRLVDTTPEINTIAGTGVTGSTGDGGLAFNATFNMPGMTATDSAGNIFVADSGNNTIRKISASTITQYAGTGVAGQTGDGGPALSATLIPYGLAIDSANLLYMTDISNCVIRTIHPTTHVINRFAGNYTAGFSGDGGSATAAQLSHPRQVAADSVKNIYVADAGNSRIRRIDHATNLISTIAGNGVEGYSGDNGPGYLASLSTPTGVTTDSAGNIYIADTNNNCIREINAASGTIRTVAGQPPLGGYRGNNDYGINALLSTPNTVVYDTTSGFLYIGDDGNRRVRILDTGSGIIYDYAGNGSPFSTGNQIPASNAIFGSIAAVAADLEDNIYVADGAGNVIRKIDIASGIIATAVEGLSTPTGMVVDSNNNLIFCDKNNNLVRKYISSTQGLVTIAGTGQAGFAGDGAAAIDAELNAPSAVALDSRGNIFIGDSLNYRVRRIDATTNTITTYAGTGLQGTISSGTTPLNTPISLVTGLTTANNMVYLTDLSTNGLWQISSVMVPMNTISTPSYLGDGGPLTAAQLNRPMGLTSDVSGNFIIADSGNYRLRNTYTFGLPQTPAYLNMLFNFTNYYATSGTTNIRINGNPVATFTSMSSNSTFTLADTNIYSYPLQGSNPVLGDQTPYIEINQTDGTGYIKLQGNLWVNQTPGQAVQNVLDSNAGLIMNSGLLDIPYSSRGITIDNKYNDASMRNLNYTGSLNNASDPALKEGIEPADLQRCWQTLEGLPLRTYNYSAAYQSTFHTNGDRIGFLTTEVSPFFPNSVTPTLFEYAWAPSTIQTLDVSQIKYTHLGATQELMRQISTMEAEIADLQQILRLMPTQRNVIH